MRINGIPSGVITSDNQALKGVMVEAYCPVCGENCILNFGSDAYLSQPAMNRPISLSLTCKCGNAFEQSVILKVELAQVEPLRFGFIGSREWPSESMPLIRQALYDLPENAIVISGGARGVDTFAEKTAKFFGFNTVSIPPKYHLYSQREAPLWRNKEIVEKSDKIFAFWTGVRTGQKKSTGTIYACKYARELGRPVHIVAPDGETWPEEEWTR